jgi:hypothetical protein
MAKRNACFGLSPAVEDTMKAHGGASLGLARVVWTTALAVLASAFVAVPAQGGPPDCAGADDTDFERVVRCMSLEELAGQLTAFNAHIALRLTGKTLDDNVRAGLGTVMGVGDPKRMHELQLLAQAHGHPPLLSFEDTERGVRTILPSSLAQSFTWDLPRVERGARMAAR